MVHLLNPQNRQVGLHMEAMLMVVILKPRYLLLQPQLLDRQHNHNQLMAIVVMAQYQPVMLLHHKVVVVLMAITNPAPAILAIMAIKEIGVIASTIIL